MSAKLTESAIESFAIKLFERLGYLAVHGPDIAPDGILPERGDYAEVFLSGRLEQAVRRINPRLPVDVLQAPIREVRRVHSPDLLANNETLHRLFTEGVPVSQRHDGGERGERAPKATYLGFTGTPIEKTDVNTPAVFGNYVDIYDIAQAVDDGATVRIYYESRLAKVGLSDEGKKLIAELDE